MKFAYADPPYYGLAAKFYAHLHPDAADYDRLETHAALIQRLCDEFPDGWAMSLHAPSLRDILPLCPRDVRVMAWVKPFVSFKPNVFPAYCWEPVLLRGGRKRPHGSKTPHVRDYLSLPISLGSPFKGAKPAGFVRWLLAALRVRQDDEFVDLFPGSGAVSRAYEQWREQCPLFDPEEAA